MTYYLFHSKPLKRVHDHGDTFNNKFWELYSREKFNSIRGFSRQRVTNVSLTLTGSRQTLALPERDVCWNVRTCPEQTPLGFHRSPKPIIYLDVEPCSQHLPQKFNVQQPTLGSAPCVLAPTVSSAGGDEPHKSLRHPAPGPPHKTSETSERGSAPKAPKEGHFQSSFSQRHKSTCWWWSAASPTLFPHVLRIRDNNIIPFIYLFLPHPPITWLTCSCAVTFGYGVTLYIRRRSRFLLWSYAH